MAQRRESSWSKVFKLFNICKRKSDLIKEQPGRRRKSVDWIEQKSKNQKKTRTREIFMQEFIREADLEDIRHPFHSLLCQQLAVVRRPTRSCNSPCWSPGYWQYNKASNSVKIRSFGFDYWQQQNRSDRAFSEDRRVMVLRCVDATMVRKENWDPSWSRAQSRWSNRIIESNHCRDQWRWIDEGVYSIVMGPHTREL